MEGAIPKLSCCLDDSDVQPGSSPKLQVYVGVSQNLICRDPSRGQGCLVLFTPLFYHWIQDHGSTHSEGPGLSPVLPLLGHKAEVGGGGLQVSETAQWAPAQLTGAPVFEDKVPARLRDNIG